PHLGGSSGKFRILEWMEQGAVPSGSSLHVGKAGHLGYRVSVETGARRNRHWTVLNSITSAMKRNLSPTATVAGTSLPVRWRLPVLTSSYLKFGPSVVCGPLSPGPRRKS